MDAIDTFGNSDEECDPRIKGELESLNQSASDVNRLEKEINEARSKYQETFCECSQELEILRKKFGRKINKARAYYETKEFSKGAQSEALLSARKFQSANGVYMAAKETISLAELRLKDDKAASLSTAWQEMLNHALIRVMDSEQEKTKSEKEHLEKSAVFAAMEKKLHILEKKHKKSIEKAKSYFDSKNELELKLQQIKQSIEDLQQAMQSAKIQYSTSLKNLEAISDGIHEARRQKLILMYPREPGVGAEERTQTDELPSLSTSNRDFDMSCSSSVDDDNCCTDTDEEEDDFEGTTKNNETQQENGTSCRVNDNNNEQIKITETHIRVKGKRKQLRKTMSLPSYVVNEDNTENEVVQSIEIETDNIILKMESNTITTTNTIDKEVDVEVKGSGREENNNKKCQTSIPNKTGRLILDPRALCPRDGRADGES